jgi:NAD(P)-dependent dehydrogenase (short-subunit alcohol dehydrogenase family)
MTTQAGRGVPGALFAPALFAGTTAIITGGGSGIGKATALGFGALGANVVIAGRKADVLADATAEIESLGAKVLAVPTDIRDVTSCEQLRDAAIEAFGSYHFVINNAGGQFMADPFSITDNGWRSVVDLNLNGTWNMCNRLLPHLLEKGRGSIVNIVHIFSHERGAPLFAHSGAARAGVVSLTRSLATYAEAANVTVNALAPGAILTERAAANYGMTDADVRAMQTRSKVGDATDMADIILFLCSPSGRMINGTSIVADASESLLNWPLLDAALDNAAASRAT